ncbi:MAG: sulfatase-like hydrolase/transferase [Deltaproteobacteria bacterium]|nr:sulfatase-like hydrolase/transferase [Deltaproteobacteria bacterium]
MAWSRSAFVLPSLAFTLAACSALPSRLAIAAGQSSGGGRLFYLAGGLLSDVAAIGPLFVVAAAVLSFTARAPATTTTEERRLDRGMGALLALFAFALLTQNATAEFRIERGVLPGPIDLRQGMGHHDFLTAEAPLLVAGRFLWANVACTLIAVVAARRLRPRLVAAGGRLRAAHGLAIATVVSGSLVVASRRAEAYCGAMNNRDALASPSAALVTGLLTGARYDGSPSATRRLLVEHTTSAADIEDGARQLGYPPQVAERLVRGTPPGGHPLSRPLDPEGRPGDEPAVLDAAREASKALWRDEAPIVFHVSLESTRADDVHAIHAEAPAEVAPFLTAIYDGREPAIAFAHAHQSGVRTSQALGAVMCGLGALPFHISASRDLGALPLRCMPDVLADARFRGRAFYGHELVFDDMEAFLGAHGLTFHQRRHFPRSAPRGVWEGVTDAAVYAAALEDADTAAADEARYSFVLTLSHHAPYTAPADLAPAPRGEVEALCRARALTGENCERLLTMRYADEALRAFLSKVAASKNAARSIVIVAADHTVHRAVPWGDVDRPEGTTQIPLFVWLPPALRDRLRGAEGTSAAWDRLASLARTRPLSNSDVPSLLLALLAESAPLRALPAAARWHTLGGQATSAHYRSVTGRGAIHGIDAHGFVFDVTDEGEVRSSGIRMESLRGSDDVVNARAHNRGEIAFLGSFLRTSTNRR